MHVHRGLDCGGTAMGDFWQRLCESWVNGGERCEVASINPTEFGLRVHQLGVEDKFRVTVSCNSDPKAERTCC